jgi:hypothetical protein
MYIFNFFEVAKTQKTGKQPSFPGILLVAEHAVRLLELVSQHAEGRRVYGADIQLLIRVAGS